MSYPPFRGCIWGVGQTVQSKRHTCRVISNLILMETLKGVTSFIDGALCATLSCACNSLQLFSVWSSAKTNETLEKEVSWKSRSFSFMFRTDYWKYESDILSIKVILKFIFLTPKNEYFNKRRQLKMKNDTVNAHWFFFVFYGKVCQQYLKT